MKESRWQKEKETEFPWEENQLNSYTSLSNPGVQHIGNEFQVTYSPQGHDVTVQGIVLQSIGAQIILQVQSTGEILVINTNSDKISSIKSRLLSKKPTAFQGVAGYHLDELYKKLDGKEQILFASVLILQPDNNQERNVLVTGSIKLKNITNDYTVISITNTNGTEHLIDPDRQYCYFALSEYADDIIHMALNETPVIIIDSDRMERFKHVQALVAKHNILNNQIYYEYFEANVQRTKDLLSRWYHGKNALDLPEVIKKVENNLGKKYLSLLTDPGMAQHIDGFLKFATNLKNQTNVLPTPFELRNLYSEYLGEKTVYRGMMLTDEELASVLKSGVVSPALLDTNRAVNIIQETLDPTERTSHKRYATDFYSEIMGRLTDFHDKENSTTISVSAYEPVARSVGYHDSGKPKGDSRHMYVFECNMPILSLIKMEGVFDYERRPDTTLTIGNFKTDEETDLEVEMFIPYSIPPSAIKNVERIDTPPPKWMRQQK